MLKLLWQRPWRMALCGLLAVAGLVASAPVSLAAGLLTPADGTRPPLEIRDHVVNVVIEDGYAITTVEQVFHNPHSADFEAIYSFPVPEKAAVSEFTYWIDGRPVSGEVLPKAEARRVYEEEKAAGREAGLAEQDGYKTFDIAVWPIRAGQDVRVRLAYIQPAHVDTGMGRYVYPLQEGGVDEERLAFWTANETITGRFSFDLVLRSAYPVAAVRLPKHPEAVISQTPEGDWRVHMDNGAANAAEPQAGPGTGDETATSAAMADPGASTRLDTDMVVYWRHGQGLPGSVDLVAYKPASEARGTFMLVVTPGDDLKPITEGRDWVFVLDKSGSMKSKFSTLAEGVAQGLAKMGAGDRFRIVLFDEAAYDFTHGFVNATPDAVAEIMRRLRQVNPGRSTNLYAGLDMGLGGLDADRSSGLILVTDGVANVGETRQRAFLDLVRKKDVRLFTAVMGNSANRPLLEAISTTSGGTAISVSNSDDIVGAVLTATSKVTHEALHGAKVKIEGIRTADFAPRKIGSLYRGQQLVLFGHYWGQGVGEVTLSGKISGQPKTYSSRFAFPDVATLNPEIERLWAFAAIENLRLETEAFGEDADRKQAITDLAVENGLVTAYTSMVVLREEVFAQLGIDRANQRRLTLEADARQKRAAQPVHSRRVDTAAPMFQTARAGHNDSSGSGAVDLPGLLLILLAGATLVHLRRFGQRGAT